MGDFGFTRDALRRARAERRRFPVPVHAIDGTRFVSVDDELAAPTRRLTIWDTEEKKVLVCPADPSGM